MRKFFATVLPFLAILVIAFAIWTTVNSPSRIPAGVLPPAPPAPAPAGDALTAADLAVATAPLPPTATAVPPPPQEVRHTIVSGDTLSGIALRYDVDLQTILDANELTAESWVDIGEQILIPGVYLPTPVPLEALQAGSEAVPKPAGLLVNGLPEGDFIHFADEARLQAARTFALGQELGRDPRAFTTAGDSTTEIPYFLGRFDGGPYDLGDYAYLQPLIDYYQGSFNHDSISVRVGLHSWTLLNPTWADKSLCLANEGPLPCEIRLHNPSVLFIRLGSNDYGVPALFDESIRQAVDYALQQGVIPVIGTKADRGEGSDTNNELLRAIAADYDLLLWDFDRVAGTMPGRGLDVDNVHMTTFYQHDYTLPEAFQSGHAMHNLTALMVLDTIWKEVILAQN